MSILRTPGGKRGRGRPRAGEDSARDAIVSAAEAEFAEHGYDGATMRGIAARAGVDAAAIHHHFGTKADLFTTVVDFPVRPDKALEEILAGPVDEIGVRLVTYLLVALEDKPTRRKAVSMVRTSLGNRAATPLLAGFLEREVIRKVAARIDGEDVDLRASLVGSQIGGLLIARYVLKLPALAKAPVDEVAARVGAAVQTYLAG
ncbi:TetR/AcrR family transcriptional regulator [Microbacterium halophytorum]|uniref:TetR/AcrR family transcriptional regulator n=1 Tax=Microbacterium halophytorum TaxID=2067568 RepID=UPI000CFA9CE9|nr:TetR family transcriptional regulator [Microbacterium halophytorum]